MVKAGWRSTNRNRCSAGLPATGRTHRPACVVAHRQVILRRECRRVSIVSGGSNSVRDATVVAPSAPYVPNACATVLRGSCGNCVARTRLPRKGLSRGIRSVINRECETSQICLNRYLHGILCESSVLGNRPIHRD